MTSSGGSQGAATTISHAVLTGNSATVATRTAWGTVWRIASDWQSNKGVRIVSTPSDSGPAALRHLWTSTAKSKFILTQGAPPTSMARSGSAICPPAPSGGYRRRRYSQFLVVKKSILHSNHVWRSWDSFIYQAGPGALSGEDPPKHTNQDRLLNFPTSPLVIPLDTEILKL